MKTKQKEHDKLCRSALCLFVLDYNDDLCICMSNL